MTSKHKDAWRDWPLPANYLQTYLGVASERGLEPARLLHLAGLNRAWPLSPDAQLTYQDFNHLLRVILLETGDHGLGLDVGWKLPPTAFGSLGYALLCSATFGETLRLCQRFWHLLARGSTLAVTVRDGLCIVEVSVSPMFQAPFRDIMLESTLTSLYRGFVVLLGEARPDCEIWFGFPEPDHGARVRERLPHVRYGMPATQFRCPAALLDRPLAMANPLGYKTALEQCEREAALAGVDEPALLARVQQELQPGAGGYPDLEHIAEKLNMSVRTLRRRLVEEGTSFADLLDDAKRRDALRLLDNRQLPVQRVAELLGYSDPANFTRAFRHWTGLTPRAYREARQG